METVHQTNDDELWKVMKALGNPVRVAIVRFVHQHPRCICNEILLHLPDECTRAQSTLSQHLKILRDAALVEAEFDGSVTTYTVNDARMHWINDQIARLQA